MSDSQIYLRMNEFASPSRLEAQVELGLGILPNTIGTSRYSTVAHVVFESIWHATYMNELVHASHSKGVWAIPHDVKDVY